MLNLPVRLFLVKNLESLFVVLTITIIVILING